jgi:hypothetical protein
MARRLSRALLSALKPSHAFFLYLDLYRLPFRACFFCACVFVYALNGVCFRARAFCGPAMERALRDQRRPPRPSAVPPTPLLEPDPGGLPGASRRPVPLAIAALRPVDFSIVRPTAFFKSLAGQVPPHPTPPPPPPCGF